MNGHFLSVAGLVLNIISALVMALVAYFILRVRADLATLHATILLTLTEYVRKEDCRDIRGSLAHHPGTGLEETPCSPA